MRRHLRAAGAPTFSSISKNHIFMTGNCKQACISHLGITTALYRGVMSEFFFHSGDPLGAASIRCVRTMGINTCCLCSILVALYVASQGLTRRNMHDACSSDQSNVLKQYFPCVTVVRAFFCCPVVHFKVISVLCQICYPITLNFPPTSKFVSIPSFVLDGCNVVEQVLSVPERYMFANVIRDNYMAHMTINKLPAAYEV